MARHNCFVPALSSHSHRHRYRQTFNRGCMSNKLIGTTHHHQPLLSRIPFLVLLAPVQLLFTAPTLIHWSLGLGQPHPNAAFVLSRNSFVQTSGFMMATSSSLQVQPRLKSIAGSLKGTQRFFWDYFPCRSHLFMIRIL